jgi:hypothetical protein
MPGRKKIHTAKWDRCVKKVRKKSKGKYNPYAVCTAVLGEKGSIRKAHQRNYTTETHYGQHKNCTWCNMGRIIVGEKPKLEKVM